MAAADWTAAYDQARVVWPDVDLAFEAFVAHIERLGLKELPAERAADLYLACACGLGDRVAVATFDREFLTPAKASIARVRNDPDSVEDTAQELRKKLLVGPPPRLLIYEARAPLSAWVRIAAARMAVDMGRGTRATVPTWEGEAEALIAPGSPEAAFLKEKYREGFQEALSAAVGALPARDRNVLRMNVVDGLTIDEIAAPYGVHRATVARWLVGIRASVLEDLRIRLGQRHPGLDETDFASLSRAVQSQLHLSLVRLLGPGDGRP